MFQQHITVGMGLVPQAQGRGQIEFAIAGNLFIYTAAA
jgi:hypothetical protein